MSIISAVRLAKSYGALDVFTDVAFRIARGEKIALVGPNGAGKTTLLRLIVGLEEPSEGQLVRARNLRIGYLPQNPSFASTQTLYGEMLTVFADLQAQQQALLELAQRMATAQDPSKWMARYAAAEERFELAGGYEYEQRIKRVLSGLGFTPEMYTQPISTLSGGQITRALLAKLLLQEPELLVLDEPTNYLDLAAREWLEAYLRGWPYSLLVVSHDRYFLNRVASKIWELDQGRLEEYRGNYQSYIIQRRERRRAQERAYRAQQELIARTEEFIRRYRAGQRSREARGRQKRLARLQRLKPPPTEKRLRFQLAAGVRSGEDVLQSKGMRIGYPASAYTPGRKEIHLFDTGEFLIRRGQCIALLGPNGAGKTTFLRTILGEIEPLEGTFRLGASVQVGYLPQNPKESDPSATVLERFLNESGFTVAKARDFLARFLFRGEEVFKEVGSLSGGERARLALAILSAQGANFLLLDEPTTHLDVLSQEVLQEVLRQFNGTILFVSHDRYLIDALATHLWVIKDGKLEQFTGNYAAYLEKERQTERKVKPPKPQRPRRTPAQRTEKHLLALEQEIENLEAALQELGQRIERASIQQDLARLRSLGQEYQELEARLMEHLARWEQLMQEEPKA
ncbi:MAG: ABC-F family ATP-binding cassette domain-containing protein [Anaerolineae bacterium]|nr:ABC-F family ATP-binding cassette domain-containing protein [Anaerolineae bacterium]